MQSGLWTAYEAAAATGGALCARGEIASNTDELPEESWAANGISIDTRTIKPGNIFVALKDIRDGHDFVRTAFAAGASAALVSKAPEDTPDGKPLLLVNDTLSGLRALAVAARDRCFGKFIAVTGSAGKTSTKEMLRAAFVGQGKVHAADKSYNNHFGVPLTLAALPAETDYAIFEIGMNHAGEITPLTNLVQPHIAIVTTVGTAHIEFFESQEGIAHAKAEIFKGLRKGGTAVLPRDNKYFELLANAAMENGAVTILSFGRHEGADIKMLSYEAEKNGTYKVEYALHGQKSSFSLSLPGEHQAMNALAVLATADALNADLDIAIKGLEKFSAGAGRGARYMLNIDGVEYQLIDESYNANPESMAATIALLGAEKSKGRKIAVLGEMKELGENSPNYHLGLADKLKEAKIDLVFAAGEMMQPMLESLPEEMQGGWAETAAGLRQKVQAILSHGDIILAKGSNASRVSIFVDALINASQIDQEKVQA